MYLHSFLWGMITDMYKNNSNDYMDKFKIEGELSLFKRYFDINLV